jgi:putative transposase
VGLARDSYRNPPQTDPMTQELGNKIVEIAHARRRFGYRRIHDLLRPEYPGVNHKRVYRLCSAADLAVRKRKKVKRPACERVRLHPARSVNEVWSMDFVSDSLVNGRRMKCLTVADDFSHECVEIAVDYGIAGEYVTRLLDRAAIFRGYPEAVRTDNGPEFTSRAFMAWAQGHGVRHILIEPVGRCTTATSRASTASSETSARTITGYRRCAKRALD